MKIVLVISVAIAVSIVITTRYLVHANRYKTTAELLREQEEKEIADYFRAMQAKAKTPDEKLYVSFEERVAHSGDAEREMRRIRISDGVDRFEAWLLARQYAVTNFGVCGVVHLPMPDGIRWRVPIAYGSDPRHATIWIDTTSGTATCDTPSLFREEVESAEPNKSPVPPALSVTPRADARVEPAAAAGHL